MSGGQSVFMSCPSCAAKYRWKDELAGKKIKCAKCQSILRMPDDAAGQPAIVRKAGDDAAPAAPAAAKPAVAAKAAHAPPPAPPEPPAAPAPAAAKPSVETYDVDDGEPSSAPPPPAPPPPPPKPAPAAKPAAPTKPAAPAKSHAPAKPAAKPQEDEGISLQENHGETPPAAEPAAGASKCPSCGNAVKPGAVICLNCGLNLKEGSKVKTTVEDDDGDGDDDDGAAPPGFKAKLLGFFRKGKKSAPADDAPAAPARPIKPGEDVVASASKKREREAAEEAKKEKWAKMTDIYLPIILVLTGFPLAIWNALQPTSRWGDAPTLNEALVQVGIETALLLPLLFIAMILATKLLDCVFGAPHTAVVKLIAIAVGPGAIGGLIGSLLGGIPGFFAGAAVSMGGYYGLLMLLFGLSLAEAMMMMFLMSVVRNVAITMILAQFLSRGEP